MSRIQASSPKIDVIDAKESKASDKEIAIKHPIIESQQIEVVKQKILILADCKKLWNEKDKQNFLLSMVDNINKLNAIASLEEIFRFMNTEGEGLDIRRESDKFRQAEYGNTKSYETIVSSLIARYFEIANQNPHEAYGIYKHAKSSPLFNADYARGFSKLFTMNKDQRQAIVKQQVKLSKNSYFIFKRSKANLESYDSKENEIRFQYDESMSIQLDDGQILRRFHTSTPAHDAVVPGLSAAHKVGSTFFKVHDEKDSSFVTEHIHDAFYLHARVCADHQNDGIVAAIADGQGHSKRDKVEDTKILRAAKFAAKNAVIELSQFTDPDLLKEHLHDVKAAVINKMVDKKIDNNDAALAAYATFNDGTQTRVVGFAVGKNLLFAWDPAGKKLIEIFNPMDRDQATINRHSDKEFNTIDCNIPHGSVIIALTDGGYEFLPQTKSEFKQERYIRHGSDPLDAKTFDIKKYSTEKRYALKVSENNYEEFDPKTVTESWLTKMQGKYIYRIETFPANRVKLDPEGMARIIGDAKDAPAILENIHRESLSQVELARSQNIKAKESDKEYRSKLGDDYSIGAAQLSL